MPEYFVAVLKDGLVRIWTPDRTEIVRTVGLHFVGELIELSEVESVMQRSGYAVCSKWAVALRGAWPNQKMTLEAFVVDRFGATRGTPS